MFFFRLFASEPPKFPTVCELFFSVNPAQFCVPDQNIPRGFAPKSQWPENQLIMMLLSEDNLMFHGDACLLPMSTYSVSVYLSHCRIYLTVFLRKLLYRLYISGEKFA